MQIMIRCLALAAMATLTAPVVAHEVQYAATLTGSAEAPPNGSPGTGSVLITIDFDLVTMEIDLEFEGLLAAASAAHIHCCTLASGAGTAGVATTTPSFPGFPSATSGSYHQIFDLAQASSYNPAFLSANGGVSGALNAFALGLGSGQAYFNIHSSMFPSGEIRGFLTPAPVPLPAAAWLLGSTLSLLPMFRRRVLRPAERPTS